MFIQKRENTFMVPKIIIYCKRRNVCRSSQTLFENLNTLSYSYDVDSTTDYSILSSTLSIACFIQKCICHYVHEYDIIYT